VICEGNPNRYCAVQTVASRDGARTMALDPATHRLFKTSAGREAGSPAGGAGHLHGAGADPVTAAAPEYC